MEESKKKKRIRVNKKTDNSKFSSEIESGKKQDARGKERYHNDYSPKYGSGYDIYEKAKEQVRRVKKSCQEFL